VGKQGVDGNGAVHGDGRAAGGFALHHDAWGRLVLTDAAGRRHEGVQPVRAFPISDPRRGIALCDADGREVLWIDDLDTLPAPARTVLEEDLSRRHLMPVIHRVLKVKRAVGSSEWEVETDRGRTSFRLTSDEEVRSLPGHRALIVDEHGIRYFVADTRALDAASRRLLEGYL
jgi:hypothetical protein